MMLGRFLSGIGDAQVMTNTYIYLLSFQKPDKYLGYLEAGIAVSFVLAPVLGSTFYELLGFSELQFILILFPVIGIFTTFIVLDTKIATPKEVK